MLAPSVEGGGPAGAGRPDGLQCSRDGMPSCGFTWPVTGVQVCVGVPCTSAVVGVQVCVCVCALTSAVTGVQVCMCARHQARRHLGSIPLLRAPLPAGAPVLSDSGDFPALPLPSFSVPPQLSQPDVGVGGQGGRERPTTFSGQPLTPNTLPPPVLGLLRIHPQCCSWD